MDQRNATNGDSTGPVPVDNPWDAVADDQLGVMGHLAAASATLPIYEKTARNEI
jgi:hypothetical protein